MAIDRQLLDKFNALADEGKYKELAELIVDSASQVPKLAMTDKSRGDSITETIEQFYASLGELTAQGEIDPKKSAVFYGLCEELATIRTNSIIETGKRYKEWQQRIANGELDDITSLIDDPKFPDALAQDMALYMTPEGGKYVNAYNMLGMMMSTVQNTNSKWQSEINKPEVKKFGADGRFGPFKAPFIAGLYSKRTDVSKEEIEEIYKKFGQNPQPATASYGFSIDECYEYKKGKPVFYKYPDDIKEIMDADTPEKIEELRAKHQRTIKNANEFKTLANDLAADADNHYESIRKSGNKRLKNYQEYKDFKGSLINLSQIGSAFKFKKGDTNITTDEYLPRQICAAAEKTRELCDAYSDKIAKFYSINDFDFNELDEFVDNVSLDLKDNYISNLKELANKLPPSSISKTIENENKQIEKIDAAIKARGYDSYRIRKAALNAKFGENIEALDGAVDNCEEAKKNVHMGGKDYDEAVEAMRRLSEASKAYKAAVAGGGLREENRAAAEKLREQAIEAEKKMNAYIMRKKTERKKKKNKELDIKGERRLEAMEYSLDAVDVIIGTLDEQLGVLDFDQARKELTDYENKLREGIADEKKALEAKANNDQLENGERLAINGAVEALNVIENIANGKGELTDDEKKAAMEAVAKLGFCKVGLYDGVKDDKDYFKAIHKFTDDPIFESKFAELTGELTRERLLSVAGEKDMAGIINTMHDAIEDISKAGFEEDGAERSAVKNAGISSAYLDKTIADANEPDAERYDEVPVSINIQAAQAAKKSLESLSDLVQSNEVLEDYEIEAIKEAYAAIAFQSTLKPEDNEKISYDDYVEQVRRLANDEDFAKTVGNVDKGSVVKFLNDDKAPEKLMDSFLSNKKRAMEEGAKNIEKNAQAELSKQIKPKGL